MRVLNVIRRSLLAVCLLAAASTIAQVNPLDPTPAAGPQAPLIPAGPRPGEVAPVAAQLPPFIKPGMRWYFHEGESIVHNVPWHLVPTAGNNLRGQANKNSGTIWYRAIDLVHVSPTLIAANARRFTISDIPRDITIASTTSALLGNASTFDKYWIHPARLAQIEQQRAAGLTINRVQYVLADKTYNALSMMEHSERTYVSQIYDLITGLLLSSSSADRNAPVLVPDNRGGVTKAQGATLITHSRFMGVRELKIPWAAGPLPAWVTKGRQVQYTGSYGSVGPSGQNHLGLNRFCKVAQTTEGVAIVESITRRDLGSLPAQDHPDTQAFTSNQLNGWWIPPQAFPALPPNTVIDEDRITHFRLTFVGVQGNFAIFLDEGPQDRIEIGYDTTSGILAWARTRQQIDPTVGSFVSEIRMVPPR